ncbi:unnamed protein product [Rodentolepis nana]|uniref:Matrix protein n=1 Tax=Rodentolepis nana TaxID=102285 RepID=A0A0R3TBE0_RODNA|nr:unnamed protein product [Rodentolepis nana]
MSWKDGSLWLSTDPDELEAATEKTFGGNLVTGDRTLTPEQFKATLNLLVGNGSEFDVNRTSCDLAVPKHSEPLEKTCAIDLSMVNQSQWLSPPEEGMEYDMDVLSKALHYMLLGWTEPSDPIFIPLPKVAYQRHCTKEADKGVRRGTRIRVHTPIDSWDRVYREVRVNPVTGPPRRALSSPGTAVSKEKTGPSPRPDRDTSISFPIKYDWILSGVTQAPLSSWKAVLVLLQQLLLLLLTLTCLDYCLYRLPTLFYFTPAPLQPN